ncbi:MAG: hypothetical protein OXE59_09545 [Bacteroidetes bacterium]|nr:hypothetical protein [Bacteroidota bacterium]
MDNHKNISLLDPDLVRDRLDPPTLKRLVKQRKVFRSWLKNRNIAVYKYAHGYNFFSDPDHELVRYCRGLVFDHTSEKIVAFPMPKFFNHFNYDESELQQLMQDGYTVETKHDGSCVLLWEFKGEWHWSTLGAFWSEQAVHGRDIFEKDGNYQKLDPSYTYMFEVIHPENRIVLDHGQLKSLVYLLQIHRETGQEHYDPSFAETMADTEMARWYRQKLSLSELLESVENDINKEGYVVTLMGESKILHRIKFKTKWYFKQSRTKNLLELEGLVKVALHHRDYDFPSQHNHDLKIIDASVVNLSEVVDSAISELRKISFRKDQAAQILALNLPSSLHSALFAGLDSKDTSTHKLILKTLETESPSTITDAVNVYTSTLRRIQHI